MNSCVCVLFSLLNYWRILSLKNDGDDDEKRTKWCRKQNATIKQTKWQRRNKKATTTNDYVIKWNNMRHSSVSVFIAKIDNEWGKSTELRKIYVRLNVTKMATIVQDNDKRRYILSECKPSKSTSRSFDRPYDRPTVQQMQKFIWMLWMEWSGMGYSSNNFTTFLILNLTLWHIRRQRRR